MLIVKSSPLPVLLTVTSFYPVDRHLSPFEGGWGMLIVKPSRLPILLTLTSPVLLTVTSLALLTVTSPRSANRHISPSCWPSHLPLWRGLGGC